MVTEEATPMNEWAQPEMSSVSEGHLKTVGNGMLNICVSNSGGLLILERQRQT